MKKIGKIAAIAMVGAGLSLFAAQASAGGGNELSTQSSVQTGIDAEIDRIKQADPAKRRELMNRFKEQLVKMNREERMQAIARLREKIQGAAGTQASRYTHPGATQMGHMKNLVEIHQAMQTEHMGTMEQMNQKQAVDKMVHKFVGGTGGSGSGGGTFPLPFASQEGGSSSAPSGHEGAGSTPQPGVPNSPAGQQTQAPSGSSAGAGSFSQNGASGAGSTLPSGAAQPSSATLRNR